MSEEAGFSPTPVVLDVSILVAAARGDGDVISLLQGYDAAGQPLILPALAVAGASLDTRSREGDAALRGLGRMQEASAVPVESVKQALRLAAVIARTELDWGDAHAADIADARVCPILTLDGAKWREHAHDLDETLHFVEIDEPGEE